METDINRLKVVLAEKKRTNVSGVIKGGVIGGIDTVSLSVSEPGH